MRDLWELLFWVVFFLFVGPWIIIGGLFFGSTLILASPIIVVGVVLWLAHKRKVKESHIPEVRKPCVWKPKKRLTITIHGQQMGLLTGILMVIVALAAVPIVLFLILFIVPPIISLPIILIWIGYSVGKTKKGRR